MLNYIFILSTVVVMQTIKETKMKRYEYNFKTNEGNEKITLKGKGIKSAIKNFNAPFISVEYINKNGETITKKVGTK